MVDAGPEPMYEEQMRVPPWAPDINKLISRTQSHHITKNKASAATQWKQSQTMNSRQQNHYPGKDSICSLLGGAYMHFAGAKSSP